MTTVPTALVMSICPSVRECRFSFHWTDFHEILYSRRLLKCVEKIQIYVCVCVCVCVCMYVCPMFMQFHRFYFKEELLKGRIPSCAFAKLKQTLITPCLDIENQNLHLTERGNCYSRNFCHPSTLPLSLASDLGTFPIDLKLY